MQAIPNSTSSEPTQLKAPRDWFGYFFTIVAGLLITVLGTWYQLYTTQRDAAAAEFEKARATKQIAVSIVEEHVLNNKKIELDRLARLIDQRRKEENISIPIPVEEVVEQAEFSIANSRHLSIQKKEEVKPIFDSFYADLRARLFQPNTTSLDSQAPILINEIAKNIQSGKPSEALNRLSDLSETYKLEIAKAKSSNRPNVLDAIRSLLSSPTRLATAILVLIVYLFAVIKLRRILQKRKSFYSTTFR
jgi:hypothetical protein